MIPSRRVVIVLLFAALNAESAGSQVSPQHGVVPMRAMAPGGTGTWIEKVWGDPSVPDAAFVFRIHNELGFVVLPHVHPTDENIVVVRGSWALGMGRRFDRSALVPLELGAFGFVSKTMAHFAWAKAETVVQVHGVGPFVSTLVDSIYELTDHGVIEKQSLLQPGKPTPAFPADCFALKIGARVRGPRGEGTVIGAQCSPANQFTQYRVQRADGVRLWAVLTELKRL